MDDIGSISGTPAEMKHNLLRQELILDADDRRGLIDELNHIGLSHQINGHVIVPYAGETPQEIIAALKTPLTMLKIAEPSLEDAYIEYLKRTGGAAA